MTGVQEKRSTQVSASATVGESSNGTKTVVKKRKVTTTRANGVKQVFSLPGQKHEAPEERDPLRVFYESLREQIPSSDMAELWMMEHGLLSAEEAKRAFEKKQGRSKLGTPVKASVKVKAEVQASASRGRVAVKAEVKAEVKTVVKAEAKAEGALANGSSSRTRAPPPRARRKLENSDSDDDFIAVKKARVRKE